MIAIARSSMWRACIAACVLFAGPVFAQRAVDEEAISGASQELRDILHEQSELRRELMNLEQEARILQQRLAGLTHLAEVQQERNRLTRELEQAESSDDEQLAARLKSKLEPLERRLDHLREELDFERELDERIGRVRMLVHRLNKIEDIAEATRWARYLSQIFDSLGRVREIHASLNLLEPDAAVSIRNKLEQQADDLQEQVDAADEFVELISRFFEALEDEREEDVEELLPEISELLDELEGQRDVSVQNPTEKPAAVRQSRLVSGEYFMTQSWSQEKQFRRPYYVSVPELRGPRRKLPVFIFLHGNGGNAKRAMQGFTRRYSKLASRYVMVFPQGYRESWNIVSERSKADDRRFIEAIVLKLGTLKNVDPGNFSVMGASNGAALVNQLAIESQLPHIRNYISGVSPLNVWQFDGQQFKARGDNNDYRAVANPMTGKRLMNISGTVDKLVPYDGGPSRVIPAGNGKLEFVAAEESTFVWARQMGYRGEQLTRPARTSGNVEIFSYLNGDVVHCKVNDEGHGATHGISEELLLDFLQGGENAGRQSQAGSIPSE